MSDVAALKQLVERKAELQKEVAKVIIGQEEVVNQINDKLASTNTNFDDYFKTYNRNYLYENNNRYNSRRAGRA